MTLLHALAELGVRKACDPGWSQQQLDALTEGMPESLRQPSGAFVTLTRDGMLRGCIGYIQPHKPLFEAVFENGYNAAARDHRFAPLTQPELAGLEIEVSVLSPPRPIPSADDFILGEHGIILHKAGRSSVFLPEVAIQQGWDRDETLNHLATKAGLAADAWREGAEFEVFTSETLQAPVGSHLRR
jgi:AmmeMemoRadiSam system protein A